MREIHDYELEVHQLGEVDVFKSIVRIDRKVVDALGLRLHGLCEVKSAETRKKTYVQVRTIEGRRAEGQSSWNPLERWILMDEELRNRLGVRERSSYRFTFRPMGRKSVFRNLAYLAYHEDPVVRMTFWLASFSVVLGAVLTLISVLIPATR